MTKKEKGAEVVRILKDHYPDTCSLEAKKDSLENELDHRYSFAEIIDTAKELGFSAEGGKVIYIEPDQEDGKGENSEE